MVAVVKGLPCDKSPCISPESSLTDWGGGGGGSLTRVKYNWGGVGLGGGVVDYSLSNYQSPLTKSPSGERERGREGGREGGRESEMIIRYA